MSEEVENIHGTLCAVDDQGILITGPSGSGKSLLCLHIVRRALAADLSAKIIADDRVILECVDDEMIGIAPDMIGGQIEVHGFAPIEHGYSAPQATIRLHVGLGPESEVLRYWDDRFFDHKGVKLPSLQLSTDRLEAAGNAVFAALGLPITV